jgi:hypothetical protein
MRSSSILTGSLRRSRVGLTGDGQLRDGGIEARHRGDPRDACRCRIRLLVDPHCVLTRSGHARLRQASGHRTCDVQRTSERL